MAQSANIVDLKPATVDAFENYIRESEDGMRRAHKLQAGELAARAWAETGPVKVPSGLIHDWLGTVLIPNAAVGDTLALIQDYDNHKNIYKPEVIDSKLISRDGDDFKIYLRLLKKKILTVILDTDHDVHYQAMSRRRWSCRSYTTRIAEVENAGKRNEKVLPADTGFGFLWRLYSYWRFEQDDTGVNLECRAISLTRDVPTGLGWVIEPMIRKLPKETLLKTLRSTRDGVVARLRSSS